MALGLLVIRGAYDRADLDEVVDAVSAAEGLVQQVLLRASTAVLFYGDRIPLAVPVGAGSVTGAPYTVDGAVADGVYVMIKPLSVGDHTIRFGLGNPPSRLYNITVRGGRP